MFDTGFDASNDFKAGAQRSVEAAASAVFVFDIGFDASTAFNAGGQRFNSFSALSALGRKL